MWPQSGTLIQFVIKLTNDTKVLLRLAAQMQELQVIIISTLDFGTLCWL